MSVAVSIQTRNQAFEGEELPMVVARILEEIARRLREYELEGPVLDVNGNRVGWYRVRP